MEEKREKKEIYAKKCKTYWVAYYQALFAYITHYFKT